MSGEQRKGCRHWSGRRTKKADQNHVMREVVAAGRLEAWHCGIVGGTELGCSSDVAVEVGLEGEPIVGQKSLVAVDTSAAVHTELGQAGRAD